MSMSKAERTALAWRLLDNAEAEDAEGYMVACDECARLISEDEYGETDGLCAACHAACHFLCAACGEEHHLDDRSEDYPRSLRGLRVRETHGDRRTNYGAKSRAWPEVGVPNSGRSRTSRNCLLMRSVCTRRTNCRKR